ncbi:MAG: hypothetical protein WAM14_27265 [Candidatus Nitrosopolaris sp.]
MHKNTYANVTTLSAIAISAILLTSFTMVGMQFSQHALAQKTTNSTSAPPPSANSTQPQPATSAPPSANISAPSSANSSAASANSTSAPSSANNTALPTVGQSFVWQGTASSQADPLQGHEKEYVAAILKPRSDNSVYSGVLTYTSSKGANVEIWHAFSPGNTTAIPKSFGVMKTASYSGKPIALTDISPSGSSGSVPFSGNAVLLHATSPFTVTYTVNAVAQPSKTVNNVQSAMASAQPKTLSSGTSSSSSTSGGTSGTSSSGGTSSSSSTSGGPAVVHHKHHGHSTSGGTSSTSGTGGSSSKSSSSKSGSGGY